MEDLESVTIPKIEPIERDLKVGDVFALKEPMLLVPWVDCKPQDPVTLPRDPFWVICVDADIETDGKRMITVSPLVKHLFDQNAPIYRFEQTHPIIPNREMKIEIGFTGENWWEYLVRSGLRPKDYKGEE